MREELKEKPKEFHEDEQNGCKNRCRKGREYRN